MRTNLPGTLRKRGSRAFTLAELLVAVAVVAALSAVGMAYGNSHKAAAANSARLSHL